MKNTIFNLSLLLCPGDQESHVSITMTILTCTLMISLTCPPQLVERGSALLATMISSLKSIFRKKQQRLKPQEPDLLDKLQNLDFETHL